MGNPQVRPRDPLEPVSITLKPRNTRSSGHLLPRRKFLPFFCHVRYFRAQGCRSTTPVPQGGHGSGHSSGRAEWNIPTEPGRLTQALMRAIPRS